MSDKPNAYITAETNKSQLMKTRPSMILLEKANNYSKTTQVFFLTPSLRKSISMLSFNNQQSLSKKQTKNDESYSLSMITSPKKNGIALLRSEYPLKEQSSFNRSNLEFPVIERPNNYPHHKSLYGVQNSSYKNAPVKKFELPQQNFAKSLLHI